jgi:hypothetical protein
MVTRVTYRQFPSSIVRVFGPKGLVGMGFVAGDRQVITCQHVAAEALHKQTLQGTVCLDLPLARRPGTGAGRSKLRARVSRWYPYYRDGISEVVILELEEEPPPGCHPVCLVNTSESELVEHKCRVFGYPNPPKPGKPPPPGGWFDGILQGRVDYDWVQLNGVNEIGYFAKPGFSGSPVWDKTEETQGVVGMIVGRDREEKVRVAYVIPTELMVEAWPDSFAQLICGVAEGPHSAGSAVVMIIHLHISPEDFEKGEEEWKKRVAEYLGSRPEEIEVGDPEPAGSIRVRLRIPKSAADRLHRMAVTEDPALDSLGISNPFDNPGLPDPDDFPSRRRAWKALGMSG